MIKPLNRKKTIWIIIFLSVAVVVGCFLYWSKQPDSKQNQQRVLIKGISIETMHVKESSSTKTPVERKD